MAEEDYGRLNLGLAVGGAVAVQALLGGLAARTVARSLAERAVLALLVGVVVVAARAYVGTQVNLFHDVRRMLADVLRLPRTGLAALFGASGLASLLLAAGLLSAPAAVHVAAYEVKALGGIRTACMAPLLHMFCKARPDPNASVFT